MWVRLWTVQLVILMMVKSLGSREWCSGLRSTELPWVSAMPAENFNFRLDLWRFRVWAMFSAFYLETSERLSLSWHWPAWYLLSLDLPWGTWWGTAPPTTSPLPSTATHFQLIFPLRTHSGSFESSNSPLTVALTKCCYSFLVKPTNKHRNENLP